MKKADIISKFSRDLCLATVAFGVTWPAWGVNVEKDVVNSATDLGVAGAYSPAVLPTTTNDVTFPSGTVYATPTTLTVLSANMTNGTLNDLNATALAISGPNSGPTARTLTLNGGGDTISGSQPTDLIYLTNGASLIIQDGVAKTLGVVLAAGADSGNIDVSSAATLTISSVLSGNCNLNKTGAGTLTFSGVNTFGAGKTFTLGAGTLNINSTTAIGSATTTNQINGGTTINNTSGAAITTANANPLTINGDFTFAGGGSGTDHDLSFKAAAITLGAAAGTNRTITVTASNSTLGIPGFISNGTTANSIVKAGAGALTLSGTNTFTGGVILNAGTLNINAVGVAGTSGPLGNGGPFIINGGTIDNSSGAQKILSNVNPITLGGDFAYGTSAGTTLNNLYLPGNVNMTVDRTITVNGAGTLTLASASNSMVSAGSSGLKTLIVSGAGNLALGGNSWAVISDGSGQIGITMAGTGLLTMGGQNTFTGDVLIKSGTARQNSTSAGTAFPAQAFGAGTIRLGDTATGSANATVQFTGGGSGFTFPRPIVVQSGNSGIKTIENTAGNLTTTLGGLLTLNDSLTVSYSGGMGTSGHMVLGGSAIAEAVTGAGNLVFLNNGSTAHGITGNNSNFTGRVTILTGPLLVNSTTALSSNNIVAVDSLTNAPTFNLYGKNQTIAGLNDGPNGGGTVTNTGAAMTLTLGGNGVYSFSGSISATNLVTLALTVGLTGGGTQILGGTNTYAGRTIVTNGTLLVNGALASTNVTVFAPATFGGSGVVTGDATVMAGATLAPGGTGAVGALTVSNLVLQTGAFYNWEYGNGTSDLVNVRGTLTLPAVATVNVTRVNGVLPQTALLFTTPSPVTSDLHGWVVRGDGKTGVRVSAVGNDVVMTFPFRGMAVFFK